MQNYTKNRKIGIFIILSLGVGLAYYTHLLRFTFYDQIAEAMSLNDAQMAQVAFVKSLVNTICYPLGGYCAYRFSSRTLVSTAMAGCGAATVWYAFTTSYIALQIIFGLYAFFGIVALYSVHVQGIRALGDEKIQGKLFGGSEATRGIFQAILGFIGVWLMSISASSAIGLRSVLLLHAAMYLVLFIGALVVLPKDDAKKAEAVPFKDQMRQYGEMLKLPATWLITLLIATAYMSWMLSNTYLTTYTVRVLGMSQELASTIGVIRSNVIVLVAGFLGGFVVDKFKWKGHAFITFFVIISILTASILFADMYITVCIVVTIAFALITNMMKSTYWSPSMQAGIPAHLMGAASGVIAFLAFLPETIVGPICGNILTQAELNNTVEAGFKSIFMIALVFSLVGILVAYVIYRVAKQREAQGLTVD